MQYSPQNVVYFNGTPYLNNLPQQTRGAMALNPMYATATMPGLNEDMFSRALQSGLLKPLQQSQPTQQPSAMPAQTPAMLQNQYDRLAQQASNALNGGLLGYQPSQIRAAGSNPQTFNAPQGNFRNSFAGLQGLLGGGN